MSRYLVTSVIGDRRFAREDDATDYQIRILYQAGIMSEVFDSFKKRGCNSMSEIQIGDFVRIRGGTYAELVKRGWAIGVPEDIDGKSAKVVSDYTDAPEPHLAVNLEYSTEEIGIPDGYLEEIV